eukprot:scaffold8377_cov17-Tisochrysis_lutea.AAC.1
MQDVGDAATRQPAKCGAEAANEIQSQGKLPRQPTWMGRPDAEWRTRKGCLLAVAGVAEACWQPLLCVCSNHCSWLQKNDTFGITTIQGCRIAPCNTEAEDAFTPDRSPSRGKDVTSCTTWIQTLSEWRGTLAAYETLACLHTQTMQR